jgi:23S rRNA pseudouridine1911/1915/1917 synthase
MYGADPTISVKLGLSRQWLHAVRLGFRHPGSHDAVEFNTEYPDDLARALDILRAE